MAKPVIISLAGKDYSFDSVRIDRAKLYGVRKRLPIDAKGEPCVKASLTMDGANLLLSGMTAQGYFTPDKVWVAQGDLEAINPDGSTPELFPATVGEEVAAIEISPIDALHLRFGTTYALEPEVLSEGIKKDLDSGVILTFPFNPRADYEVETGILVGNENGYFAMIGQKNEYEFVGLASVVSVAEEANSDTSEDLDFEMF